METKKIKDYFLAGSFRVFIAGIIGSVLSVLWLMLKFSFNIGYVKIYFIEIILLLAGPILLLSTIKSTVKTYSLLSKLKRNNSVNDVYSSLSNITENVCFNKDDVIISNNYLFIKDEVAVIPYLHLSKVYIKYLKNDKKEITAVQLYCDTLNKKKIPIFRNIKSQQDLVLFVESVKQKNSNIIFEL